MSNSGSNTTRKDSNGSVIGEKLVFEESFFFGNLPKGHEGGSEVPNPGRLSEGEGEVVANGISGGSESLHGHDASDYYGQVYEEDGITNLAPDNFSEYGTGGMQGQLTGNTFVLGSQLVDDQTGEISLLPILWEYENDWGLRNSMPF